MDDRKNDKTPGSTPRTDEPLNAMFEGPDTADRIFDSMRDGIVMHSGDGTVRRINRSMARKLGISEDDAVGKTITGLFGENICRLSIGPDGGVADEAERRTFTLNGREYDVECTPVIGGRTDAKLVVTVLHDVTEKRNLDKQRADILSMVSHDVKAPLTTILGYCELILDGSMGSIPDEVDEGVGAIMRSGKKVLGIVEDFLIGASTDAGMLMPGFTETDIVKLCRDIVDGMLPEVERVNRTMMFSADGDIPPVECDPRLIERVVANLLDNAVKYSSVRGTISLELHPAEGGKVEVRVVDDGIGIAEEDLPYVFDSYRRGSRVGKIKGSGLGLSIVRRIVEMHGGDISITSQKGEGTTVSVLLPCKPPP